MRSNRLRFDIFISREVFLGIPLLLLMIPFRFLFAFIVAAAVHELFHTAAITLLKIPVRSLRIGMRGMIIETHPMSPKQELLCAAAGPLGGMLLLLFLREIPLIAMVGMIQSVYNLLPVYPTDGGRILRCLTSMILSQKVADAWIYTIEILTQSAIFGCCVFATFWLRLGILPLVFGASLLLRWLKRK